jgi:hypothetical protein
MPSHHAHAPQERDIQARDMPARDAARAREGLRERIEREAAGTTAPGSWALDRARGIAENARLREEYGRYRDALYAQQRDDAGERRNDAWSDELALRRVESQRRWEAKQTQRAVVRAITPRGLLRNAAYGIVEHVHQRRIDRERAHAYERWERAKTELPRDRAEAHADVPLRYRDYVAERAQAGDDGARRVREYLDRQTRNERSAPVEREAQSVPRASVEKEQGPASARVSVRSVEQLREELLYGLGESARIARRDASTEQAYLAQYKRHEAIGARLDALARSGVHDIALERLGQVERALEHVERGEIVVDPVPIRSEQSHAGKRDANTSDGYGKRQDDLAEREDALEREKTALPFVVIREESKRRALVERETPGREPQRERLTSRTVKEVRDDLLRRLAVESKAARADEGRLRDFPALHERFKRIDAELCVLDERGVVRLAVERDASGGIDERFAQIERGIARSGTASEEAAFKAEECAPRSGLLAQLAETERALLERSAAIERGSPQETEKILR